MASPRYLSPEQGYLGRRRGHVPQISISDHNHHVTEAIGDMYGDDDGSRRDSAASSFTASPPLEGRYETKRSYFTPGVTQSPNDSNPLNSQKTERHRSQSNGSPVEERRRNSSLHSNHSGHSRSPPLLTRTNSSDTASQHFPLNDIDYESSPAAVAQELSNLQAIRRMSMNVDAADPDLPSFGSSLSVPTSPPSNTADEDDASRMFWVPARIHPELAPREFKTFVEDRVERIRKRSTDGSESSSDGIDRSSSDASLNRRKSMLSRTIDSGIGYQDGADVLERKKSRSSQTSLDFPETTLQELEQTFADPVELVRKLSLDTSRRSLDTGSDVNSDSDAPILPGAPGGQSLKRSTRTNYRRGSFRKGERVNTSSRRSTQRVSDGDTDSARPLSLQPEERPAIIEGEFKLSRVQTEPMRSPAEQPDNFSRPTRGRRPMLQPSSSMGDIGPSENVEETTKPEPAPLVGRNPTSFVSRIASNGRSTALSPSQGNSLVLPEIVETPPLPSDYRHSAPPPASQPMLQVQLPERKSSHEYARQSQAQQAAVMERSQLRPAFSGNRRPNQTLDDMANHPSMMPGMSTRTDALTFIPSFTNDREEKKSDKKSKDKKDSDGSRKPSWHWLRSQDAEKEKEKEREKREREREKERERDEKEFGKKSKVKPKLPNERLVDSTRLDLLNTTTDGPKGRESLVLDRDSIKLDGDRRKEPNLRKGTTTETKSSGASGIFSSLFGGNKKKSSERDAKKADVHRRLSPEPPPRKLRADIDFNWTRFSILEERAIYRMAHLKLANPRRALYSQVLLSNFMYSYLAKVQQMHPQIQIPAFVQKQQANQKSEPQQEPASDEYAAWQKYQEQHEPSSAPANNDDSSSSFVEDYDPGHQEHEDTRRKQDQHYQQQHYVNGNGSYRQKQHQQRDQQWDQKNVYTQQGLFDGSRPPEEEESSW